MIAQLLIFWVLFYQYRQIIVGEWLKIDELNSPIQQKSLEKWQTLNYEGNIVNNCGQFQIIGGYDKFGQSVELEKNYTDLKNHTSIRVTFKLWIIDFWFSSEHFFLDIDGDKKYSYNKNNLRLGKNLCGKNGRKFHNDEIIFVSEIIPHNSTELSLKMHSSIFGNSNIVSWGISDYNLEIFEIVEDQACNNNNVEFGTLCLDEQSLQRCYDNLGRLDDSMYNNTSITHECKAVETEENLFFQFVIQYLPPYRHIEECYTHHTKIQNQTIPEGEEDINVWKFDIEKQYSSFTIGLKDIDERYFCALLDTNNTYTWTCRISQSIFFGGNEQLEYRFSLITNLNSIQSKQLNVTQISALKQQQLKEREINFLENTNDNNNKNEDVNIQPLVVRESENGCEIDLNVQTVINLCTDYLCTSFLEKPPQTIAKNEELFIQHKIVQKQYSHWYMQPEILKIENLIPEIIQIDSSIPGQIVYHIKSKASHDILVINAISKLYLSPPNEQIDMRRLIYSKNEDEEKNNMNIWDKLNQYKNKNKNKNTQNNSNEN